MELPAEEELPAAASQADEPEAQSPLSQEWPEPEPLEETGPEVAAESEPAIPEAPAPAELPVGELPAAVTMGRMRAELLREQMERTLASQWEKLKHPVEELPAAASQADGPELEDSPATEVWAMAEAPPEEVNPEDHNLYDTIRELPPDVLQRLGQMEERQILQLAGQLAAKKMWEKEKEIRKAAGDPVDFWERTREKLAVMLRAFSFNTA